MKVEDADESLRQPLLHTDVASEENSRNPHDVGDNGAVGPLRSGKTAAGIRATLQEARKKADAMKQIGQRVPRSSNASAGFENGFPATSAQSRVRRPPSPVLLPGVGQDTPPADNERDTFEPKSAAFEATRVAASDTNCTPETSALASREIVDGIHVSEGSQFGNRCDGGRGVGVGKSVSNEHEGLCSRVSFSPPVLQGPDSSNASNFDQRERAQDSAFMGSVAASREVSFGHGDTLGNNVCVTPGRGGEVAHTETAPAKRRDEDGVRFSDFEPMTALRNSVDRTKETPVETAARLRRDFGDASVVCILGGEKCDRYGMQDLIKSIAEKLCGSLPHTRVVFATGGATGVERSFASHCSAKFVVLNLLAVGDVYGNGTGQDVYEQQRAVLGLLGDVYISFAGGPGVAAEARAAFERGACVIPLIRTGGASSGMFDFPVDALNQPSWATKDQWSRLEREDAPVTDTATAVAALVGRALRTTSSKLCSRKSEQTAPTGAQKLYVSIVGATNLRQLNIVCDAPWCACEVQSASPVAQRVRCETRANCKATDPEWNETYVLDPWNVGEALEFTVYDKGLIGSKVEGRVTVPSSKFFPDGFDGELPIVGLDSSTLTVRIFPAHLVEDPVYAEQSDGESSGSSDVEAVEGEEGEDKEVHCVVSTKELEEEHGHKPLWRALVLFSVFFCLGSMYGISNEWSFTDSVYFMVITITTVGYGDLHFGTSWQERIFGGLFVFLGVSLAGSSVAVIFDKLQDHLEAQKQSRREARLEREKTAAVSDAYSKRRHAKAGLSWNEPEMVKMLDEEIDCLRQRLKRCVQSLLIVLSLGIAGIMWIEDWSFADAFYWACVTMTTVGYGDLGPVTVGGRWFAVVYVLLAFCLVAEAISFLTAIPAELKKMKNQYAVLHQFGDSMNSAELNALLDCSTVRKLRTVSQNMASLRAPQISRAEFILWLLEKQGKLDVQRDIAPCGCVFDVLDTDGSGTLNQDDIQGISDNKDEFRTRMRVLTSCKSGVHAWDK
eukprot:TRINITY_DN54643_c0_g1_i1.p1 TRINITY_DN54643_c0_g1~~TRINITY_DN54643_c0_g1_i1.p1  ORF type:complete len:1011 (-),score=180.05 TRINITY_DN54643_c0_g1_i1:70-3102(-)